MPLSGWLELLDARRTALRPAAFITGMPKSGTTAIVRLMSLAAGVKPVSDPFHVLDQRGIEYRDELFGGRLACSELMRKYATAFRGTLVKDPNFVFFVDDLRRAFPHARWVFTIRDPRDNIRSILNRLGLPGRSELLNALPPELGETWRRVLEGRTPQLEGATVIERLAVRWTTVARVYLKSPRRMILSRYEDFLQDKEKTIQDLCQAVGLVPSCLIREFVDIPFQPPGDREISWNSFFAADDLASINQICGDQMLKFGYDASKSS